MPVRNFRPLINAINIPIFLLNVEGHVLQSNSAANKKFNLSVNIKGFRFDDLTSGKKTKVNDTIKTWTRSSSPLPGRIVFKSKEGSDDVECLCKGNVIQPETDGKSLVVMVQCHDKVVAHRQFLSLNEKIILLNKEIIERRRAEDEVRKINKSLEKRVGERTKKLQKSNKVLSRSLKELEAAHQQLIRSERLASLGGMVAGVAHEINNPVGVCVTASSFLNEQVAHFQQLYTKDELSRQHFESFLDIASESSTMILANLERASDLVKSFKQLAVDQISDEIREFDLKQHLTELCINLEPSLKKASHQFKLDCPSDIRLRSYPGAISQIFYNLVRNSIVHGFDGIEKGVIKIDACQLEEKVIIRYSDNGIGIPKENRKRVFEPFYTTKRNQGGSGLGMNIVFNLVTDKLLGSIEFDDVNSTDACYVITFPCIIAV